MSNQRDSRRSDNWVTFGLGGLAIVLLGLIQGIPMLVTLGVIEQGNVRPSNQAVLSMALYAYLVPAIGLWLYAKIARHHYVRWGNGGNILFISAAYLGGALIADYHGHPAMVRAALDPLFWVATHWQATAAALIVLIGFIAVTWAFQYKSHTNPETVEILK